MRKPFYNSQKKSWWIRHNGKQIRLGKTRDEAYEAWHKLGQETPQPIRKRNEGLTVGFLVGEFLTWVQENREPATYEWHRHYLLKWVKYLGENYPARDLRPVDHLERFISREFKNCSENGIVGAKRSVLTCLNWCVKNRHLSENPLRGAYIRAPGDERREATYQPRRTYLSPEEWEKLIAEIDSHDWLYDFLTFLRETGCRPQEARILEARHFDRQRGIFLIPAQEAKGKRHNRIIPLNDAAMAIATRLVLKRPTGPLFRNHQGEPLTKDMIHGRLYPLKKKLGIPHLNAYAIRHSFITDALRRGVSSDLLRNVVGHRTSFMIQTVYDGLHECPEALRDAARKATGEVA